MPTYVYLAADNAGKTVKGKLTASNELDLEERLSGLGLMAIDHKVLKSRKKGSGKVGVKDMIMFCVHMEQLSRAGVPLLESLADMRDSADHAGFKSLMSEIYENVKNGDMLSAAMEKRPDVFGEVFIGLVSAGEETGNLTDAFTHLAYHLKWNNDLRKSIKKAMMYPVVLLFMMSGVIALMMLYVVPQLVDFLESQGFDLPFHTRALIATSKAFVDYWYIIFGAPIITVIVIITLYRSREGFRYKMDRFLLRMPVIGSIILKINLARFARFFGVTFGSGMGVLECLNVARNVVGNLVIKEAIQSIIISVSEGTSLTRAISQTGRFPNLVIRMFKVGEESGNMEEALENINFFYDREVKDGVAAMIGVIQPTLTVVMGLLLLWIMAAIFGPLYGSFSEMQF